MAPTLEPLILPPEPPAITPGFKTTEFWVMLITLVSSLGAQMSGVLPAPWGAVVAAIASTVYTIGRIFLKAKVVEASAPIGQTVNPNS